MTEAVECPSYQSNIDSITPTVSSNISVVGCSAAENYVIKYFVNFQFSARNLVARLGIGSLSSLCSFYEISKQVDGDFRLLYRSETVNNSSNPNWQNHTITLNELCNNDEKTPLKIDIYDFKYIVDNEFVGTIVTDLEGLMKISASAGTSGEPKIQLITPDKGVRKKTKDKPISVQSGCLLVNQVELVQIAADKV